MDDIQSWWEVPSIAHFCSLFRVAFNLLDFDIEELEEALLTDGAELTGSSLLQELIVRLLCGCLGNNGISVFNYQMFLRRLFRTKCRELGRENPFDTDIDFQFLPLRTKVEILHALCDFRLDADDVVDVLKNLDSDSLRVHPLGHDENKSAYWYFYGTRLYRENFPKKRKKKKDHDRGKSRKKKRDVESSPSSSEDEQERVGSWQVLCFTEDDWQKLAESLADSDCKEEQALYAVLTEDFLPEIPRLFEEKERLQRKRLLESQPRRTSSRLEKMKASQKAAALQDRERAEREKEKIMKFQTDVEKKGREMRAIRRSRSKSESGSSACEGGEYNFKGRQTNNSLSSATGNIIIQPTRQTFRTSQLFRRTREDLMTGLYKVLDRLKTHEDAWPFVDPVEEEYAPRYYSVIAKPMDLQTMEDKLDNGEYGSLQQFKGDFQLIVDNCRQYNGSDNEYTQMVSRLQDAFHGLVDRYLEVEQSSDDDLAPQFIRREERVTAHVLSSPERNNSRTSFTESNSDIDSDSKLLSNRNNLDYDKEEEEEEEHYKEEENRRETRKTRYRKKTRKKRDKKGRVGGSSQRRRGEGESSNDEEESESGSEMDERERVIPEDADEVPQGKGGTSRSGHNRRGGRSGESLKSLQHQRRPGGSGGEGRTSPGANRNGGNRERGRAINYREMGSSDESDFSDSFFDPSSPEDKAKNKSAQRKIVKRTGVIRNAADIEALELATEQTLKDINKWLDDTPRFSDFSSNSNSPLHITYTEEMANIENEYRRRLQMDKPNRSRERFANEMQRRRMFKEQMGLKKRREIQRTIDRLQPGKSKGNLLSKENQQVPKEDGPGTEPKFSSIDSDDNTPRINLGKVLASDILGLGIGDLSRKNSDEDSTQDKPIVEEEPESNKEDKEVEVVRKLEDNKGPQNCDKVDQKKEKPTPNLSAWFKAFGAPKPTNNTKKKPDEDPKIEGSKPIKDEEVSLEDDKERRVCVIQSPARRQRKTSTGSSISERSSFSQEPLDGNSPRPSLDEPYLSPQPEVKTYYHSPINGTIKVGFYQDTCFPRGTSEKSGSPRETPGRSPRELPGASPRTPYCSPRDHPQDIDYMGSPKESGTDKGSSPKSDYTSYPATPSYRPQTPGVYTTVPHYPPHLQYFDHGRPLTDQYRSGEKTSLPLYPMKKRIYNESETPQSGRSSPESGSPSFKTGSFTPTKGAVEGERTFTPNPGRLPSSIRVPDPSISMGLPHHPLQHHLMETYAEERHLPSGYFGGTDGIYGKPQGAPVYPQSSVISNKFGRESGVPRESDAEHNPQSFNRVISQYQSEAPQTVEPVKSQTPVPTYQTRPASPDTSPGGPINYSSMSMESSPKEPIPTSSGFIGRQVDVDQSKNTFSYPPNNLEDVYPPKVSSPFNRPIPQLAPSINYAGNTELNKIPVPPIGYGNRPELMAAKMNYNHPMADLMQNASRYNYPVPDLIQGKTGPYNRVVQEFMQGKAYGSSANIPTSYERPIGDIGQNKVGELRSREVVFNSVKPEQPKVTKKGRKKKSSTTSSEGMSSAPSGFQQYVGPTSEGGLSSLKSGGNAVTGSAFNFGSHLKDSYSSYLEDMRSSYFGAEGSGSGKGGGAGPSYFLGPASARPPTYPHPFIDSQYQHFLQRHPEELLRPMMIHQGLLPPPAGYHPTGYLGMHDAINRPTWL